MPYYTWHGITLEGSDTKGTLFARSMHDLEKYLLKQDIGLIRARPQKLYIYFKPISAKLTCDVLQYLSVLLKAHIRINQALILVSTTVKHTYFKAVLTDMAAAIEEGTSFSGALAVYNTIFDDLTQAVVKATEHIGDTAQGLELLVSHNETMRLFKRKVRSALLMPLITLGGFLALVLLIFIVVIPRFELFFNSFKKPLPQATQTLISFSNWLTSFSSVYILSSCIISYWAIKFLCATQAGKYTKDKIIIAVPVLGSFLCMVYRAQFLRIVSMLLKGKVHLLDALSSARTSIPNEVMRVSLANLIHQVESGKSLSAALVHSTMLATQELESLVKIGESSGELIYMITQAADIYQQQVYSTINTITAVIQPLLLIFLGLLIALLVYAVYMPLFTLSSIIT